MPPNPKEPLTSGSNGSSGNRRVHFEKDLKQDKAETNEDQDREVRDSKSLEYFSNLCFWSEKYDKELEKFWGKIPSVISTALVSIAVFIFGLTARGDWLIFGVYFLKYMQTWGSPTYKEESEELITTTYDWLNVRFKGYFNTLIYSVLTSYVLYFGVGGFLHWYYYVRQRDHPETWKCQPKKWLSPALERHEIMVGSISLVFGSCISAAISTYVINGGDAIWLYINPGDYGYIWLILQVPVVFIMTDYLTYWHHRMYHIPFLYKNFHKLHHTYKQPTAFSVTAIHPVEFMHMQAVLLSPIFIMPVFWANYMVIMMYTYYHGIIDHSGINFKRYWWQPWQPDCIFHDNHHQYFHVNFGFNIEFWDYLHGTYRQKDRIYREDIYYGKGKAIDEASASELQNDIAERQSENPLAYPENKYEYNIDQMEVGKKVKSI